MECDYSATATDNTQCRVEKCESGYAQDPDTYVCEACPDSCDVCIWDTSAANNVRCLDGGCSADHMQTTNVAGELVCEVCLDDCMTCERKPDTTSDTICLNKQCNSGYGLTADYNCEECSTGCLWCDIDAEGQHTCTSCDTGYVLADGECKACPDNCHTCTYNSVDDSTICASSSCVALFAQNSGADDKGCEACPERCSQCTYNTENSRTECVAGKCDLEAGYALDADAQCGACSSNCLVCTTQGADKCDTCASGYRLNAEKTCEACSSQCSKCASAGAGKCDSGSCADRYVLDADSKECKACAANCESCSSNGAGLCDKNRCDDFYAWDETSMLCLKCPDNCNECEVGASGSTECLENKCQDYYGLKDSDKKCHACPNECIRCTDHKDETDSFTGNLRCTACDDYFTLNSNLCGSCPMNCAVCTYETGFGMRCSSCKAENAMDADRNCHECPDMCSECTYDADAKATKCNAGMCAEGYAVDAEGKCKTCSDLTYSNCATCTDIVGNGTSSSTCLTCKNGYTKQDDDLACLACPSTCGTCEDKPGKYCEVCEDGFLRSDSKEVCGFTCHSCNSTEAPCTDFSASLDSTVCSGACWVSATEDAGGVTTLASRGCSTRECTSDYQGGFCQDSNGLNNCEQCCTSADCNTGKVADLLNNAADVKPSILLLLTVALAAMARTM